jgi:hypothetical protein
MADAFGLEVQAPQMDSGPGGFSGMCGKVQTLGGGVDVDIAEEFGRALALVAANAEANDVSNSITSREFRDGLRRLGAKLTYRIENPEQ